MGLYLSTVSRSVKYGLPNCESEKGSLDSRNELNYSYKDVFLFYFGISVVG